MSARGDSRGVRFDAIVVGGGLAGMMTALALRGRCVALLSAAELGEATSSAWAQGGIAAALGSDDAPALHAADTVAAGAGLVDSAAAERLAADGPRAIRALAELGARFDRDDDGTLALGREAAHSRRRIARAGGDATGAELVRAAREAVEAAPWIERFEGVRAKELLLGGSRGRRIAGAIASAQDGRTFVLRAPAVVLATGGVGGLYRFTTNPPTSRGAGLALAARAGARLVDLEFVQFHPTALDVASDPLPLVTEALRGEGALLIDERGERIMRGVDPALELASRDVVARRVFAVAAGGGRVALDARPLRDELATRFPTVFAACLRFGIDPRTTPIPVVAAAHYHMGGIDVDLDGRTCVPGLFACGEAAATGVHGANRLASNSLLEAAVYPERIARAIVAEHVGASGEDDERGDVASESALVKRYAVERATSEADWHALRAIMYAGVGVERDARGLAAALDAVRALEARAAREGQYELRDAAFVGAAIAQAALARRETRGSHVRLDFPAASAGAPQRAWYGLADLEPSRLLAS